MFTGLVEAVGTVTECRPTPSGMRVRIETTLAPQLAPGDSLAVNGVCLTVTTGDGAGIHADVGPETMRVTTLGSLTPAMLVNLERPLRADSRFGGHFVQGHVDSTGQIEELRAEDEFFWLTVGFPRHLAPYLVTKGSIAVDGISLTVAALGSDRFDVQIVPFTLQHTNLQQAKARDRVNLECDMVGKYVIRAAELAGLSFGPVGANEVRH
jgi:riboflavin synthase alpha subunit